MPRQRMLLDQPAVRDIGIDMVVNWDVVENDDQGSVVIATSELFKKVDYLLAADGRGDRIKDQLAGDEIERTDHVHVHVLSVAEWRGGLGMTNGRPGTFHVGGRGKAAFIAIHQTHVAASCRCDESPQRSLAGTVGSAGSDWW